MIKGCSRKMIVIKDTGSDFFDEAYFILKPQGKSGKIKSEHEFVNEANRIISQSIIKGFENSTKDLSEKKNRRGLAMFLLGFFACAAVCGICRLIFYI